MRKRNCRVVVYFSKDELNALTKKVRKTRLSREGYIRAVLADVEVKAGPNADVPMLIQEVRRTRNQLKQTLQRLSPNDNSELLQQIQNELSELRAVEKLIVKAYTAPTG